MVFSDRGITAESGRKPKYLVRGGVTQ